MEVNFPNFTTCTIAELQLAVPELKGLKPATDQQELPTLLDKVGAKTVDIDRNTPNLISRETVMDVQERAATKRTDYDYLILARVQEKTVELDEFRVDLKSGEKFQTSTGFNNESNTRAEVERASQELAASQGGHAPISQGFAESWVHFYPTNWAQATYRFLGEHKDGWPAHGGSGIRPKAGISAIPRRIPISRQNVSDVPPGNGMG